MSKAQRGRKHSDETRAKMRDAHMGQGLGRKHSDEARANMRAAHKGNTNGKANTALVANQHERCLAQESKRERHARETSPAPPSAEWSTGLCSRCGGRVRCPDGEGGHTCLNCARPAPGILGFDPY